MKKSNLTVPEQIKMICQEIDASYSKSIKREKRIITRQAILQLAMKHKINQSSVLPADYCDNGKTSRHSDHEFLHWIGRGKYILN